MEEYKAKVREYFNKFKELPFQKKALLLGVPLFLVASALALLLLLSREDYVVLYTALGREDLNAIVSELDRQGIKYRISPDGRTIYVPESVARELRLQLAAKGIPKKGVVGYEIFDKGGIGLSRFQLQVNYKRAIEGELARTIMSLKCVDYARVHIALPEDTIFVREREEAKASVFLKLLPGCKLTPEQVKAIRNLVAGSVENLPPQNVVVIDDRGRDLTAYLDEEEEGKLTKDQLEIKRRFERELEKKILRVLEQAIGYGRVSVSVSAELDFSRMKKKEELYDPDLTAVVSEQKKKERTTKIQPQGIPGTQANVPPAQGRNFTEQTLTEKKETITNYEVSKREIYYEDESIKIKRISVGVLVDKSANIDPKKLEELIVASAGLDPKRGDRVSVVLTEFATAKPAKKPAPKKVPLYLYVVLGLASLVFLGLITFGILRLLKRKKKEEEIPVPPTYAVAPPTEEVKKSPYEEFVELVQKEPKKAAIVLKNWLKEG